MYTYAEYVKRPLYTYEKRPTKETQIYITDISTFVNAKYIYVYA